MSKFLKLFAGLALLLGAVAFMPGSAQAQHWHHGWHRGPGWGWGPAFGFGLGFGYPYYYGGPYYAGPPACGWAPVYSRKTHRLVRQVWRCW
jgi:hypothetical protein